MIVRKTSAYTTRENFLIITSNEFRKNRILIKRKKVVGRFTNQLLGHSLTYYG